MLDWLYDFNGGAKEVAVTMISLALILILGFAMTRLSKRLRLPNVTAYIVTGILLGPYVLDVIPASFIEGTEFVTDIALAFIAFSVGEHFEFAKLKKTGAKSVVITLFEALTASLLVFLLTYSILGLDLVFSIVLAALASATAPASTMMTIRQTGARGDYVDTLLQVVAMDDVVGLVAYSVAIAAASSLISGSSGSPAATSSFKLIIQPLIINLILMALGAFFAWLLKVMTPTRRTADNRLIIAVAILLLFSGVAALFDVSPLLGCMMMGMVFANIEGHEKLFKQLNYFSPPILLIFFVRSGLSFDLGALTSKAMVGAVPLVLVAVLYFLVRFLGKYMGAYAGALVTGKPKEIRYYLGLALAPQAGVAIGLSFLAARQLGPDVGGTLQTIILASSVLYELMGPASAKLGLYLSRSYEEEKRPPLD